MATELPRCVDCGSSLKAVPSWLASAKVSFTCVSCPRRSSRGIAAAPRAERPIEARSSLMERDTDADADTDDMDEDADMDLPSDELDDVKDDADL